MLMAIPNLGHAMNGAPVDLTSPVLMAVEFLLLVG